MHSPKSSLIFLLTILLESCGGPKIYPQGSLADQILVARHQHEGKLTNQTCEAYGKDQKCAKESLIEYDLSDVKFRDEVRRLGFICKIGAKQYKFCPDKPGFCRTTYTKNWFQNIFGGGKKNVEFIPATPTQVLIDSHIKCFSPSRYDWDSL